MKGVRSSFWRREREAVIGRCILALALTGIASCVGPARSFAVFETKAARSSDEALSSVQATKLAIHQELLGRSYATYLSVVIEDAEGGASTAESQFASIQPPDIASDRLRRQLAPLLARAVDVLESARIAVRRDDLDTLRALRSPLTELADQLDRFSQAHEG